ncbi:hypothetical protein B0H13DRAFT_1872085 [Mycena leptocephala]|nr:hypothetical protein B0H13DRAFT_1872085 [Mycena leptocephala]
MIAGGLQQVTIVTVSSRKTDESATAENCGGHEEYVESCNSLQQQSDLHQVRVLLPHCFNAELTTEYLLSTVAALYLQTGIENSRSAIRHWFGTGCGRNAEVWPHIWLRKRQSIVRKALQCDSGNRRGAGKWFTADFSPPDSKGKQLRAILLFLTERWFRNAPTQDFGTALTSQMALSRRQGGFYL